MDIKEAVKLRHSVRHFEDRPIEKETADTLRAAVDETARESGLRIELMLNEPEAFKKAPAKYGRFDGCNNYIAFIGPRDIDESIGYFGEKLVLLCQQLGLNTCWVALTYSNNAVPLKIPNGEKLHVVIAVGYGKDGGKPHKSKPMERLCRVDGEMPQWFIDGMESAMLAPTALNQQRFLITLQDGRVAAKALIGPLSDMDLGIVKYHFEIGSGIKI